MNNRLIFDPESGTYKWVTAAGNDLAACNRTDLRYKTPICGSPRIPTFTPEECIEPEQPCPDCGSSGITGSGGSEGSSNGGGGNGSGSASSGSSSISSGSQSGSGSPSGSESGSISGSGSEGSGSGGHGSGSEGSGSQSSGYLEDCCVEVWFAGGPLDDTINIDWMGERYAYNRIGFIPDNAPPDPWAPGSRPPSPFGRVVQGSGQLDITSEKLIVKCSEITQLEPYISNVQGPSGGSLELAFVSVPCDSSSGSSSIVSSEELNCPDTICVGITYLVEEIFDGVEPGFGELVTTHATLNVDASCKYLGNTNNLLPIALIETGGQWVVTLDDFEFAIIAGDIIAGTPTMSAPTEKEVVLGDPSHIVRITPHAMEVTEGACTGMEGSPGIDLPESSGSSTESGTTSSNPTSGGGSSSEPPAPSNCPALMICVDIGYDWNQPENPDTIQLIRPEIPDNLPVGFSDGVFFNVVYNFTSSQWEIHFDPNGSGNQLLVATMNSLDPCNPEGSYTSTGANPQVSNPSVANGPCPVDPPAPTDPSDSFYDVLCLTVSGANEGGTNDPVLPAINGSFTMTRHPDGSNRWYSNFGLVNPGGSWQITPGGGPPGANTGGLPVGDWVVRHTDQDLADFYHGDGNTPADATSWNNTVGLTGTVDSITVGACSAPAPSSSSSSSTTSSSSTGGGGGPITGPNDIPDGTLACLELPAEAGPFPPETLTYNANTNSFDSDMFGPLVTWNGNGWEFDNAVSTIAGGSPYGTYSGGETLTAGQCQN